MGPGQPAKVNHYITAKKITFIYVHIFDRATQMDSIIIIEVHVQICYALAIFIPHLLI